MRKEIVKLEGVIEELNTMIDTTGYFQKTWEQKMEMNEKQTKIVGDLEKKLEKNDVPPKALEIFSGAQSVLSQEFNFYTFAVQTNSE